MQLIRYTLAPTGGATWPFVDDERLLSAFERIRSFSGGSLAIDVLASDPTDGDRTLFYKGNAYNYLSVSMEPVPVINPDGSPGTTSQQRSIAFRTSQARDFAYVMLAGRFGLAWWAVVGDDFDLTKGIVKSLPCVFENSPSSFGELVVSWAPTVFKAQSQATVWKLNKGKRIGNWNLAACRHVTDLADTEILLAAGLTIDEMEAIWTAYERVYMDGADGDADD